MDVDEEAETMTDEVLRKIATGTECFYDDNFDEEEEGQDGDGSVFEDLDELAPVLLRKPGKAKSLTKLGPMHWPPAEVDIVCQNRYALDWPETKDYRQNYLSETDKTSFNLKNQSKYLDIILLKAGITQDAWRNIPTTLYDQGLPTPLPAVPGSQRFPDKEVMAIVYVMVVVAHPSSQNVANNDPDGFGHTCLMGSAAVPQDVFRRSQQDNGGVLPVLRLLDDK